MCSFEIIESIFSKMCICGYTNDSTIIEKVILGSGLK